MKINRQKIIQEFGLSAFGVKGWLASRKLPCPWCGKGDKFGVILNESGISSFHCFHASCSEKGSIVKLFKKINRLDLLSFEIDIDIREKLKSLFDSDIEIIEPIKIQLPIGYKQLDECVYLRNRNWTKHDIKRNKVGFSVLDPKLRNYIIFPIEESGTVVGWLARSKRTKEWHKKNLQEAKEGKTKLILRYKNSEGTIFEDLLGGIDDVDQDDRVILVEGIMDKVGVDHYIKDKGFLKTSCCYTCGTNVSEKQIVKLLLRGVESIILMYDYGTIKKTQQFGLLLSKYFDIVKIAEIKDDTDPGEMFEEDFDEVMSRLKDPMEFKIDRLPESTLKV